MLYKCKKTALNVRARHSLRRPRFPIRQMHFHYRVTFTGYIRCFCANTSHDHFDLDLWPFDLERVSCTALLMSDPPTNFYYPRTIGYWVTSSLLNIWSDHISVIWNSHCACAVSRDLQPGAKIVHIFKIPDPNLPIHFVTIRALRRRLCHVVGEK